MSLARSEGFKEGQAAVQRETPQTQAVPSAPPMAGGVSPEEVQMKVKAIMNQTYQTLATRFKTQESFETKEILNILVTTIKVIEKYFRFCLIRYLYIINMYLYSFIGNYIEGIVI